MTRPREEAGALRIAIKKALAELHAKDIGTAELVLRHALDKATWLERHLEQPAPAMEKKA